MAQDNIFSYTDGKRDFTFDSSVTEVFDDMLNRSVPCYRIIIDLYKRILEEQLKTNDHVWDLGCSTGTTLLTLASQLKQRDLNWHGIDSSSHMIAKAKEKLEGAAHLPSPPVFECKDMTAVTFDSAGAVILNYTIQFLRPMQREEFLSRIFKQLRSGGILLVSEKTLSDDSVVNRMFINRYLNFKREQGYSDLEISRKREALENVLIPYTAEENLKLMQKAGFAHTGQFFQWFNFSSFIAVKE